MINSKMLFNAYGIEGAKKLLLNTDHKINIAGVEEVFYPYILMEHSIFVGTGRLSKLNKFTRCIIDGVTGSTYEANGTPRMIDIEFEERNALEMKVDTSKCRQIGHDFVMKQFLSKAKLLMAPDIKVIVEEVFYKRFFIMHCLDDEERNYYIMVDAVDGGLSVLDH